MSYRDAEAAFRERADELELEVSALEAEIAAKRALLEDLTTETARLRDRTEREGPGGGEAGAKLLRMPLVASTLLGIGAIALFFQFFVAIFVRNAPREVIALYLILSGPTLVGTAVLFPFRKAMPWEFRAGLLLTGLLVTFVILGAIGVLHDV